MSKNKISKSYDLQMLGFCRWGLVGMGTDKIRGQRLRKRCPNWDARRASAAADCVRTSGIAPGCPGQRPTELVP